MLVMLDVKNRLLRFFLNFYSRTDLFFVIFLCFFIKTATARCNTCLFQSFWILSFSSFIHNLKAFAPSSIYSHIFSIFLFLNFVQGFTLTRHEMYYFLSTTIEFFFLKKILFEDKIFFLLKWKTNFVITSFLSYTFTFLTWWNIFKSR